ncbi:MAG TPA: GerMN domain-containing protein [Anaerovoracaceae bacterium]|nr:GerMN domain-containing protein [Anaerovoracaceae bacterium]
MKNKRILLISLSVILALGMFGFTACGSKAGKGDSGTDVPGTDETAAQSYRVTLFYANEEYIATGDESLEKFKVYESEMTSKPGEAYMDALELLKTSPEKGYSTVITDQIKFNDVYLEGDTVNVDFDSNGLNGGSLEETFLISQIVDTLMNSFKEVKQVQFLVDGEAAETLMGHVDTAAPFTKDLFTE